MDAGKTCPSSTCTPGNSLIGIRGPDGRIKALRTPLPVTAEFAQEAARSGPPEARMRFASACQTSGCSQWTGTRCGVIDRVLHHLEAVPEVLRTDLQPCAIRATCRWFDQSGATACHGCDLVVTDLRAPMAAE